MKDHIKVLKKLYNIIPLDDGVKYLKGLTRLKPNSIVITFDDGYKQFYRDLFPVFSEYNVPATIFLLPAMVDTDDIPWLDLLKVIVENSAEDALDVDGMIFSLQGNRWNIFMRMIPFLDGKSAAERSEILKKLGKKSCFNTDLTLPYKMLSWDEIKRMQGLITYGAHTQTHPNLAKLDRAQARNEIAEAKKRIEEVLSCDVKYFAYPFGDKVHFADETVETLKELHFECAVTLLKGTCKQGDDLYTVKRFCADGNINGVILATLLSMV